MTPIASALRVSIRLCRTAAAAAAIVDADDRVQRARSLEVLASRYAEGRRAPSAAFADC